MKENNINSNIGEVWVDIDGYSGYYQVSSTGRVKRLARYVDRHAYGIVHQRFYGERIIKPSLSNGYPVVNLCKENKVKHVQVHRIVAESFIPNPQKKEQVNHKNGIRNDNRVENLEWVTNLENQRHSFQVLGRISGRKGKPNTAMFKRVRCIELNRVFPSVKQACLELGVPAHIGSCCTGNRKTCGGYHWEYEK